MILTNHGHNAKSGSWERVRNLTKTRGGGGNGEMSPYKTIGTLTLQLRNKDDEYNGQEISSSSTSLIDQIWQAYPFSSSSRVFSVGDSDEGLEIKSHYHEKIIVDKKEDTDTNEAASQLIIAECLACTCDTIIIYLNDFSFDEKIDSEKVDQIGLAIQSGVQRKIKALSSSSTSNPSRTRVVFVSSGEDSNVLMTASSIMKKYANNGDNENLFDVSDVQLTEDNYKELFSQIVQGKNLENINISSMIPIDCFPKLLHNMLNTLSRLHHQTSDIQFSLGTEDGYENKDDKTTQQHAQAKTAEQTTNDMKRIKEKVYAIYMGANKKLEELEYKQEEATFMTSVSTTSASNVNNGEDDDDEEEKQTVITGIPILEFGSDAQSIIDYVVQKLNETFEGNEKKQLRTNILHHIIFGFFTPTSSFHEDVVPNSPKEEIELAIQNEIVPIVSKFFQHRNILKLYKSQLDALRDYYGQKYAVLLDDLFQLFSNEEDRLEENAQKPQNSNRKERKKALHGSINQATKQCTEAFQTAAFYATPIECKFGNEFYESVVDELNGDQAKNFEYLNEMKGLLNDMTQILDQRQLSASHLIDFHGDSDYDYYDNSDNENGTSSSRGDSMNQKNPREMTWYRKLGARLLVLGVNYGQGWLALQELKRRAAERDRNMPKFPLF